MFWTEACLFGNNKSEESGIEANEKPEVLLLIHTALRIVNFQQWQTPLKDTSWVQFVVHIHMWQPRSGTLLCGNLAVGTNRLHERNKAGVMQEACEGWIFTDARNPPSTGIAISAWCPMGLRLVRKLISFYVDTQPYQNYETIVFCSAGSAYYPFYDHSGVLELGNPRTRF